MKFKKDIGYITPLMINDIFEMNVNQKNNFRFEYQMTL